jgi:hypothetical protein
MSWVDEIVKAGTGLSGIYKDVKSVDASQTGVAKIGSAPSTVVDQSDILRQQIGGNGAVAASSPYLNIGGVSVSQPILMVTGLLLVGLWAIRVIK